MISKVAGSCQGRYNTTGHEVELVAAGKKSEDDKKWLRRRRRRVQIDTKK